MLQQVLVAQGKPEAALEIAERGRARAFVELLVTKLQDSNLQVGRSNQPPSLHPPTIEQIKKIARQHKATLVEYSIVPEKFLLQGKLRGIPSELFIWVIQPTGEVTFRRVDLKPLQQQPNLSLTGVVAATRCFNNLACQQAVTNRGEFPQFNLAAQRDTISRTEQTVAEPPLQSNNPYLKQLHQLLIEPIADLLPTDPTAHVIFIPQEQLYLSSLGYAEFLHFLQQRLQSRLYFILSCRRRTKLTHHKTCC